MARLPFPAFGARHRPPAGPSAMSVLAALLDRSVEQIAEAAADVRRYNREAIGTVADVWDNNLFPLFRAASTSNADERERRATAALEWMARFGERRRSWMAEQAAIAGYDIEPLLPPAEPYRPGRDSLGHVMAPQCRLTPQNVADLVPDYDLATASVRHLQLERAGTRLTAFLRLVADRTFGIEDSQNTPPALVELRLDGVTDAVFDLSDTQGATLDATPQGIVVSLGTAGRLRAATGEYRLDDRSWHLSSAGRRADAVTPPRAGKPDGHRRAPGGGLGADGHAAAFLLHWAMLDIRSVRYAERADRVPVLHLCRAFSQAGEAILDAGSRRGSRRRESAFRAVIRTWAEQGGPELHDWFARSLDKYARRPDLVEVPQSADRTPPSVAAGAPSGPPAEAVLVMAAWTAAHTRYGSGRPATAQLQLALPPGPGQALSTPWRLRTVSCTGPDAFHLDAVAFRGPGPLVQAGKPTAARRLDLHRGALLIAASDGSSASMS